MEVIELRSWCDLGVLQVDIVDGRRCGRWHGHGGGEWRSTDRLRRGGVPSASESHRAQSYGLLEGQGRDCRVGGRAFCAQGAEETARAYP